MANLTTYAATLVGLRLDTLFVAANGGGDTAETGKGNLLLVRNGGATTPTVTLSTPETVDGLAVEERVVTIPANATLFAIPVTDRYRNPATGRANITYSAPTDLTVLSLRR
jgi:hypothetical protein